MEKVRLEQGLHGGMNQLSGYLREKLSGRERGPGRGGRVGSQRHDNPQTFVSLCKTQVSSLSGMGMGPLKVMHISHWDRPYGEN
jgi:hypothetical protein